MTTQRAPKAPNHAGDNPTGAPAVTLPPSPAPSDVPALEPAPPAPAVEPVPAPEPPAPTPPAPAQAPRARLGFWGELRRFWWDEPVV